MSVPTAKIDVAASNDGGVRINIYFIYYDPKWDPKWDRNGS